MRGPRSRNNKPTGAQGYRGEARRFLTTPMAMSMIRGLDDETRARAWLGVANQLCQEDKIGPALVEKIATKVKEAQE